MEREILHCDLNNFFASVECRDNPKLRGKPVVVCGDVEERHGIVLAKTEEAKRFGIKTGDTLWQARIKCPELVPVIPHMNQYIKYSMQVRQIYEQYTDRVEPYGIDECFLDVTGCEWMFGTGREIADKIREQIKKEIGLTISAGVSYNKIFAKLGSDMKKPDAVTTITRKNYQEKVWPRPVRELFFVGHSTENILLKYGIRVIGDIAQTEPEFLNRLLGKNGLTLWQYANGKDDAAVIPIQQCQPMKSVSHGITCREDLVCIEEIQHVLFVLAQDVAHRLRQVGLMAQKVQVTIKDCTLNHWDYIRKLPVPTQNAHLLAQTGAALAAERYDWKNPVRALVIRAVSLLPWDIPVQTDLFFDSQRLEKQDRLERVMEQIQERFGKQAIRPASLYLKSKLPMGHEEKFSTLPGSLQHKKSCGPAGD